MPHGHAAWREARSASAVFSAQKHRRERVSAKPIERHQEVAEAMFRGAELRAAPPPEGAGEPAVDTCCLISAVAIRKAPASPDDCRSPVWNTGCSCGNECCRPYRSKTAHHAQRRQHGSATKRSAAAACRKVRRLPALWRGKAATCPQFLGLLTTSPIRQQGVFHAHH